MQADIVPACICLCKKVHAIDGFVGPVPVQWMQFPIFRAVFCYKSIPFADEPESVKIRKSPDPVPVNFTYKMFLSPREGYQV